MTNIRIDKIQIKRGTVANLPTLDDGELFYAYDTKEHYLGMGGVNQLISKDFASLNQHYESVLSRFGINSSGKFTIDSVEFAGGGNAGSLVFNTLAELQAAYPGGTTQPAWIVTDNSWYYWSGAVADTTAPTVTISPAAGLYNTSKSVTLTANETATIYYTTDGSTPTTASAIYSAPISVSANTTLKYFAKDTAGNSSAVQTAVFTIDTALPVLTITAGGTFTGTKSVTMSANETADIYYTIDGSTPTTSSTKYTSALSFTSTATLKAFAKDTAGNSSAVQTVTYTLDAGAPADTTAPIVTASPAAGTYTSAQSVTLTVNETATIYYTTNGTTPTTASTVYTGPISISATTTLQFIGKDTAGNTSAPVAATYTINIPDTTAPVLTITPAAAFTDTQTVVMSANETATIYYTLDDTDPKTSGTKLTYTTPLTLTATDTIKAYARDTAGNESAVQTVTYTKEVIDTSIVAKDSFNRADGVGLGNAETGQVWKYFNNVQNWNISNNAVVHTGMISADSAYIDVVNQGNYRVSVTLKTADVFSGVIFKRSVDPTNNQYYALRVGSATSTLQLVKNLNAGTTTLSTLTKQISNGDKLSVEVVGSTYTVYINDIAVGLSATDSEAILSNNTGYGLYQSSSTSNGPRGTVYEDFKVQTI